MPNIYDLVTKNFLKRTMQQHRKSYDTYVYQNRLILVICAPFGWAALPVVSAVASYCN